MEDQELFGEGRLQYVSTDWLFRHLDDDNTILDVQPDIHDYIKAHVPGSVYLAEKTLRAPSKGLPGHILPAEILGKLFGRVGLENGTPAVVYTGKGGFRGWGDGLDQCMMAYTLLRANHSKVYMLDGGFDKWVDEGRIVTQEFPDISDEKFKASVEEEMFVDLDEVKERKDDDDAILLDARPKDFYTGVGGPWIRNGHIPGAVNLPWAGLMDPENKTLLRPRGEILEKAEEAGATQDKLVICSCGTGREATNEYAIFKHLLSYPKVKLYEGSFTEWSSHRDLEVRKGDTPG